MRIKMRTSMRIKILRQAMPDSQPYWQEFSYEWKENQTVAGMLEELNYKDDLTDINGNPARRIQWECSCLQGMCGACAMVINHRPALACETFLRDLRGETVTLEPLRKFPTVCDLVVDRGIIQENLKKVSCQRLLSDRVPQRIHGSVCQGGIRRAFCQGLFQSPVLRRRMPHEDSDARVHRKDEPRTGREEMNIVTDSKKQSVFSEIPDNTVFRT